MKKYQMPNVEFVQINAMRVIMESPVVNPEKPVAPPVPGGQSGAPRYL